MFDISFGELAVIGVVALVVIGPEKLPKVARTVGALVGRAQRYVHDVKADIQREVNLTELKQLQNEVQTAAQTLQDSVQREVDDARQTVSEVQAQLHTTASEVSSAVNQAQHTVNDALAPAADTVMTAAPPAELQPGAAPTQAPPAAATQASDAPGTPDSPSASSSRPT